MRSRDHLFTQIVAGLFLLFTLYVAAGLALPYLLSDGTSLTKGQMLQTLNNMRQLHLATEQMAIDGSTNASLGWPGDAGGTFSHWAEALVKENYLTTNDLAKLLSVPGRQVKTGSIPAMKDTGLLVYAVKAASPQDTVFLTTANFTNTPTGGALDATATPYGAKGFVVFQRGGSGAIMQARPSYGGTDGMKFSGTAYVDANARYRTNKVELPGAFAPLCR